MEVILNQDVDKIGKAGVVMKVKDGFARNYLIPNKLAVLRTPANLKRFKQIEQKKAQELDKIKSNAQELQKKLANFSLSMPVLVHEEEKLYGSISSLDIVNALKEEGIQIGADCIVLEEPIKALGIYEVSVKLHPEILTTIKVWVVKK